MINRFATSAAATALFLALGACAAPASDPKPATSTGLPATPPATPAAAAGPAMAAEAPPAPAATAPATGNALSAAAPATYASTANAEPVAQYRDVTVPTGTALAIDLRTTVASDTSQVEDRVSAALREPVSIDGVQALPAGTLLVGHVTEAARSARVKGRARVGFRFTSLDLPGEGDQTAIRTSAVVREAAQTKKADAAKIGGSAAGGAVLGAILGGGDGAAKGAAIGGAAGTGVVLSTRGKEVTVPAGTNLIVRLQSPITVRVRR